MRKPLLMPVLTTALTQGTPSQRDVLERDPLRRGTLAAQAFSWGGDVALLGSSERAFLAGVVSFFAAHVAYLTAFLSAKDRSPVMEAPGPRIAGAAWLALAPFMASAAGRKDPHLRVPIAAYSSILSAMFATSTMLDHELPERARKKVVAGATLFLLSDALLGIQEFLLETRQPKLDTGVMATYTAGQWLIADGVAGLLTASPH